MEGFNQEQLEAYWAPSGPTAVIASAGSGKTTVVTARIARYLKDEGVTGYNILCLTFTNQAAKEMRQRLKRYAGELADSVSCGTIHGQILRHVLNEYRDHPVFESFGLTKDWFVIGKDEQDRLYRQVKAELSFETISRMEQDSVSIDELRSVIGLAKSWNYSLDIFRKKLKESHPKYNLYCMAIELWSRYEQAIREINAVDYDDILNIGAAIVSSCETVRRALASRFKYVFVDEFQDTNLAQFIFIREICKDHQNLFSVGDPKQAIYGFRGSLPTIFNLFYKSFPGAKTVNLFRNYRSSGDIIDVSNRIAASMPDKLAEDRALLAEAKIAAHPTSFHEHPSDIDEANGIVEQIMECRSAGYSWGDMAILYRKNSAKVKLEKALFANNIPCVVDGDVALLGRREIRDLLAFLRFAWQPWDKMAAQRIFDTFPVGATVARFNKVLIETGTSPSGALDVLCEQKRSGTERLEAFRSQMSDLRSAETMRSEDALKGKISALIDSYFGDRLPEDESARDAARDRLDSVTNEVSRLLAAGMEARDVLSRFALQESTQSNKVDDAVRLTTIHGSKGLEYPIVFILSADDESMPGNNAEDEKSFHEERRIFYVAVTRAKERLYLSSAAKKRVWSQEIFTCPSRFLNEIGLVTNSGRAETSLTDNEAFGKLPPIKIINPDAEPLRPEAAGEVDSQALDRLMKHDPNFSRMVSRFNATVMMCMPNKGKDMVYPTRRGIQSS